MPELLTPGVIIQERDFGPNPIEGVSTSTTGFVGEAEWGPSDGPPTLVTSFPDFQRKFGGFVAGKTLAYAVKGYFDNGGRRAFIARVAGSVADPATAATGTLVDGYDVQLLSGTGVLADAAPFDLRVGSVVGVAVGDAVTFIDASGGTVGNGAVTAVNAAASILSLTATGIVPALTPGKNAVRYLAPTASPGTTRVAFVAAYKGIYGRRLAVRLVPVYLAASVVVSAGALALTLQSVDGFVAGQVVEMDHGSGAVREYRPIATVNAATRTITFGALTGSFVAGDAVRVTGWRLDVFFDGALVEQIGGISSDNTADTGLATRVNATSAWVAVTGTPSIAIGAIAGVTPPCTYPFSLAAIPTLFDQSSGDDGAVTPGDVVGTDVPPRTGLKSLEAQEGINILVAPGFTDVAVVNELISQAERLMDRFAIFESANNANVVDVLNDRYQYNSRYAGMYHPWVKVSNPLGGSPIDLAPSGHIAGCFARTDNDRGVFKAPANVVIRGILDFSRVVPDGEQDLLNPAGVNVLRSFNGLGRVIWGARTISAEGLWKYVPVRRLFIFLEQSIIRGTRFAVFEPNDQRLWARLRDAVTNFLTSQWRAGALFGSKPEEAFFVRVDETTTTQDDRDNGRVNIIVGIAPVKPAEFIVFQIGQAPSSVIVAEQA